MEETEKQTTEESSEKQEQIISAEKKAVSMPLEHLMLIRRKKGYSFFKRIFDFITSAVGLVVGVIPMIVFTILLKKETKGKVFYKEERLGRYGTPFKYVKFRTSKDEESELFGKTSAFLIRTRLENLPQLWAIFRGKMSFVGPEAASRATYEAYEKSMPGFSQRLKAKPGITGFSQVNCNQTSDYEKAVFDIEYLKKRNVFVDCKILFKAIGRLFSRK